MSGPLALTFLKSAAHHQQLGRSRREVAIIGRSNVGKSSLINALANRKKLAKTSKTPGATQLLNAYEIEPADSGLWLVDLPGYGYAKVSKSRQDQIATMINQYMTDRKPLSHVLVLIDANTGPTDLDVQTTSWLDHIGLDFDLIATKIDKVKPSRQAASRQRTASKLGRDVQELTWVSAQRRTGLAALRMRIRELLSN